MDTLDADVQKEALAALTGPIDTPRAFAFFRYTPPSRPDLPPTAGPPALRFAPPGRSISPAQLKTICGPDTLRARPIRGWRLVHPRDVILVTAQRVRPGLVKSALMRLVRRANASLPPRRLRIITGDAGAALIESVLDFQKLRRLKTPTPFRAPAAGPHALQLLDAPLDHMEPRMGTVTRTPQRLAFNLYGTVNDAHAFQRRIHHLAGLCGGRRTDRMVVRYREAEHLPLLRCPHPDTDAIFEQVFKGISRHVALASAEGKRIESAGASPTYGELTPRGLSQIFSVVDPRGKAFCDLGSGWGRAVIYAALGFPLKRADGVELSETRAERAQVALKRLNEMGHAQARRIHLVQGDMLAFPVRRYDVLFISNLCFGSAFDAKLAKKFARELRPGTHVFSSRPIHHGRAWDNPMLRNVAMSWTQASRLYHCTW
ncbi:MAG: methyltransferase domain-containing protein [Myxococcota bacterium]